ncbi:hypothetical protein LPJ75_003914, partial [Coemansia sp. RSA 2598]
SPALLVSGSQALAYRQILVAAQLSELRGDADSRDALASVPASASASASEKETAERQTNSSSATVSKSKAKREKKKRRAARHEQDALNRAKEWLAETDGLGASITWSCCEASQQASKWHRVSFVIADQAALSK